MPATLSDTHDGPSSAPLEARDHLFVALQCARPLGGASRHALDGVDEVALGRGEAKEVVRRGRTLRIAIADARMSTAHARIVREGRGWTLYDEASKNGTFVGARRTTRAPLAEGDVIRFGHTIVLLRTGVPTPADARDDVEAGVTGSGLDTLSPAFGRELERLGVVAASSLPIVLLGETGTGKEVVARAVHVLSRRRGSFVAVNCGALPDTLVERELFGHVRGAFSGAVADAPGLFRAADGGTLLLDEIAEMAPEAQVALLRVLQEREVTPVGATRAVPVDVRVVAATHRPVDEMLRRGTLREDLYARLAGHVLRLPPLDERREDIGLLAGATLKKLAAERGAAPTLTPAAGEVLFARAWPRNVRELATALGRAAVLGAGTIDALVLDTDAAAAGKTPAQGDDHRLRVAMGRSKGNVSAVARELATSRTQVLRLCERYGIDPASFRDDDA